MEKLEPHRRQFYANLVEQGPELAYHPGHDRDHIFRDVGFPELRPLHLFINNVHLAQIRHCRLEELILDPRHEYDDSVECWVNQDTTAAILDQVADIYPNVRTIKFVDRALVAPGVLEEFRGRMPKLETFDHDLLVVKGKTIRGAGGNMS